MEKLHKLIQTLQASPQKVKLLQEINSQLLSAVNQARNIRKVPLCTENYRGYFSLSP